MDDTLKEVYELASRALECQADLGHKEIIFEQHPPSQQADVAPVVESAPAVARGADSPQAKTPEAKMSHDDEVADYGSIPPLEDIPVLIADEPAADAAVRYPDMETHRRAICDCTRCPLGKTRTKFVYGAGNPHAKIMFIGEAPGRDEDLQGEPFVGRAGKLLDKILAAMGFSRDDIFIANILKCRPPNNRDPQPDEMKECMPYLKEQIRLIQPLFICAMGRISAQGLLDTTAPLGRLRKRWHRFEGIPLLATYHPAALLRFSKYKRDTWEDMKVLMAEYERINRSHK